MGHRFPHEMVHDGFWGPAPWVVGLAVFAFVGLLAALLVMSLRKGAAPAAPLAAPAAPGEDAALREARMRYARGELTREQFLEISSDLGGGAPPSLA